TLNRPEKANSLTAEMLGQLIDAVGKTGADTKVLVITGRGKVFSAGANLEEAKKGLATSDLWETLSGAIAALPCMTIAALNGTLAGGAFGMALACDIRIAVPAAKFFYPVIKLGFLPRPSDPLRLSALIGPARAKMILVASQKIDSAEALSWGLIDRIVEPADMENEIAKLSQAPLNAELQQISGIKRTIPDTTGR
ncbi:MAG: enoyl-CoA hydratase/isomerase family protein, partial [Marinosulfonomonas sp.]|nr:enoyl-CoA hydratase/isomerase family protein [Marinosulfonomonas sp.]